MKLVIKFNKIGNSEIYRSEVLNRCATMVPQVWHEMHKNQQFLITFLIIYLLFSIVDVFK